MIYTTLCLIPLDLPHHNVQLSQFSTVSQCVIALIFHSITMCYCPHSLLYHNVLFPSFSTISQFIISLILDHITMRYCQNPLPYHNMLFPSFSTISQCVIALILYCITMCYCIAIILYQITVLFPYRQNVRACLHPSPSISLVVCCLSSLLRVFHSYITSPCMTVFIP